MFRKQKIDDWSVHARIQSKQIQELSKSIKRVRELHKPKTWKDGSVFCLANCEEEYPCLTIQALDGEK